MDDQQNTNAGSNSATGNDDASHEGVNMDTGLGNQSNNTVSDEVSGTTANNNMGGTIVEDKGSLTPYQKMVRRSYGVSKISSAKSLQALRNEVRKVRADLKGQLEEMNASVDSIEDPLDRLAQKDEIGLTQDQVAKLDEVLESINDQVTSLLNG